jgi:putative membrane protein
MKRILIFSLAAILLMFGLIGCNSEATNSSSFTTKAAQGGMSEVLLGNLALAKGQSADVKQFAELMVADHTRANNDLKEIAARKSVALPTDTNDEQKSLLEKLSKLSGADFDKAYVKAMVDDHEKDVDEFTAQAKSGTDADIKAFAAKTLPTLQSHLDMIKGIKDRMMK